MELLSLELTKPRSKSFLVSTWYRPPNCPADRFIEFEEVIDKIEAEFQKFYLLGDLNVNMFETSGPNYNTLTSIFELYGLSQMINDATRVTPTTRTLIDLCLTSTPEKVTNSGVHHLGISDHSLVYMTQKAHFHPIGPRVVMDAISNILILSIL